MSFVMLKWRAMSNMIVVETKEMIYDIFLLLSNVTTVYQIVLILIQYGSGFRWIKYVHPYSNWFRIIFHCDRKEVMRWLSAATSEIINLNNEYEQERPVHANCSISRSCWPRPGSVSPITVAVNKQPVSDSDVLSACKM